MRNLWRFGVVAGLVTAGLVLAVPAGPAAFARQRPHAASPARTQPRHRAQPRHGAQRAYYGPWSMRIPSIGVNAPVVALSGRSGYAPVPPLSAAGEIGWWRFTARPGSSGSTVFVGHVDTYRGPAVFYNLYRLVPGDVVALRRPGRGTVWYRVRWVKELRKGSLTTRTILGRTRQHRAWLITCGGAFNYATRSYVDNIIVSAQQIR